MFRKLPSLSNIINNLRDACIRFPLAVVTALAGTVTGLFLLHNESSEFLPKLLMCLGLAFPLFVSAVLYFEERNIKKALNYIVNAVIVVFLAVYYFYLPDSLMYAEEIIFFRFIFWVAGFSLLVTFIKYISNRKKINDFWQYNRYLLQGLSLTMLYTLTINFGLFIALASVNYLFDLDIDEVRYAEIWIVMIGAFAPVFFLSRLPRKTDDLSGDILYPRELKLFSQFVLVPLVTLYFVILYAYVVRILITGEWPKGILAYMIIGFSFAGVLTYMALYPLREKLKWVAGGGRIFFIVLIPQVGMLFWSLWFRVSEYGITEKRYLVFIFGLWLLGYGIYTLVGRKKDIRLIPATIFVIILLASFGPWGAFAVSKASQTNRLKDILARNELLSGGKITKAPEGALIDFDDRKEISATIRYLYKTHGPSATQVMFAENIDDYRTPGKDTGSPDRKRRDYNMPRNIVEKGIGFKYVEEWEGIRFDNNSFNYFSRDLMFSSVLPVSGFDYIFNISQFNGYMGDVPEGDYRYTLDDFGVLEIFRDNISIARHDMSSIFSELASGNAGLNRAEEKMQEDEAIKTSFENENISFELYITNISGEKKEAGNEINHMQGYLLFSLKQ